MKKIGLSLSMCVKDIAEGKVSFDEVAVIVAATCARDAHGWERLMDGYGRTAWRDLPTVPFIVARLRAFGKIVQPRIYDPDHSHSISKGWWIDLP